MGVACSTVQCFVELEEKKDNLKVYKFGNYDLVELNCPLCDERINETKKGKEIISILRSSTYRDYEILWREFRKLIEDYSVYDVFPLLEPVYDKIIKFQKDSEEKRYYKYTCENKKKDCYLIVFQLSPNSIKDIDETANRTGDLNKEFITNESLYFYTLKNKSELQKKKLLEYRKMMYDEYIFKEKQYQFLPEWENITFQKEYDLYKSTIETINRDFSMKIYGNSLEPYYAYSLKVKYLSSKKKVFDYVYNLPVSFNEKRIFSAFRPRGMDNNEKLLFAKYVNSRLANS